MRIMVALEDRFFKDKNGGIYSNTTSDYKFWERYLQVFDEVVVLARVKDIGGEACNKPLANGPNVRFIELPYYVGPCGYLKQYRKLQKTIQRNLSQAEAFILRIPGVVGTCLWKQLCKDDAQIGRQITRNKGSK